MNSAHASNRRAAVLLIEDDDAYRSSLALLLDTNGYHVVAAEDGPTAIEAFGDVRNQIELVILDVVLPGMSGLQTFHELQRIDPDVPIVLMSGYEENRACESFPEFGVAGFIGKPTDTQNLKSVVRSVLG